MAQAAVVAALRDKFTSMLVDKIFQEVLLVTTFREAFQSLCDELNKIKDLSLDAAQFKDARDDRISYSMSSWLRNLEEILTDAEHIAEECAAASKCKLRNPIFRYKMGKKIQGLKLRSSNVVWSNKHFKNLESVLSVNDLLRTSHNSEDKETSSAIVAEIYTVGMEKDIKTVTDLVLQEGSNRGIAIMGMGGSGKTLLLHKVFKNERVRFDHGVWLSVSQKFDYQSLLFQICRQIKANSVNSILEFSEEVLKDKIGDLLDGKRCLFAIDDVWEKFALERIGLDLQSQNKIVITTRHKKVADKYDCTHRMGLLSQKNSFKLFCIHAFPKIESHQPPQDLEDIARKITEKCSGLPLALKSVGRYMAKSVRSIPNDWESTLDRLLQEDVMNDIMPCLRLSYSALPHHLKPCFLYFSAFPKNTEIETEYLVYAWISEGFVATREDAYNVGRSYIKELIDRCLVEGSELSGDGQVKRCKVHDFFHDLADSVEQPTCFFKPGEQLNKLPVEECSRAYRISLIRNNISEIKEAFKCQRIRTLLLSDNGNLTSIYARFFDNLMYLSILDLSRTSIKSLPRSVGKLSHLKLLNLSSTMIKKLPHSLTSLKRLLFLDVSNCNNLEMLYPGIGKHKFMVHLNVEGSKNLKWLPAGISRLVSLKTLKGVEFKLKNAANARALQLRNLKGLILLEELSLNVDPPADNTSTSLEGIFGGMTKMRNLSFRNSSLEILLSLPQDMNVMKHLEILRLYKCVVPKWMFELRNLMELELHGHHKYERDHYKGLQNIPNLRKIHLSHITGSFPDEFGEAGAFPNLEELLLEYSDFSQFPKVKDNALPKLKRVRLQECPKIRDGPGWHSLKSRTSVTITSGASKREANGKVIEVEISDEGPESNREATAGTGH